MWSAIIPNPNPNHDDDDDDQDQRLRETFPCNRSKHSVIQLGSYLYLLAGKNGHLPLKDFWRYNFDTKKWQLLRPSGDVPPSLQDHTVMTFEENIYVFGGEVGFSADNETPLWIYQSKENVWRKCTGKKGGARVPKGRRGHTAIVYHDLAFVYGGYCDLRGSSNELWIFHFATESWHLLANSEYDPPARHKHSSILHNSNMWVYGGMTNLEERADLWRFDLTTRKWFSIKCKVNPGPLHSHSACKLPTSMLLFGGERGGQLINELWKFHFATETWQQIQTDIISPPPQPLSESCAIVMPKMSFSTSTKHSPRPTEDVLLSRRDETQRITTTPTTKSSRRSDFAFLSSVQDAIISPRKFPITPSSCSLNFFKDISKLSQINLTRLTQNSQCNYHILNSNEHPSSTGGYIDTRETTNQELQTSSRSSSSVAVRRSWMEKNAPLTPSEAAKLVYLEGEEAPAPTSISEDELSNLNGRLTSASLKSQYFGGGGGHCRNHRLSFPLTNTDRLTSDSLVRPAEEFFCDATSDYVSYENLNKLFFPKNGSTDADLTDEFTTTTTTTAAAKDILSFSNPNYSAAVIEPTPPPPPLLPSSRKSLIRETTKQPVSSPSDFTAALNSPADSVLDDTYVTGITDNLELMELRPKPPNSLLLTNETGPGAEQRTSKNSSFFGYEQQQRQESTTRISVFFFGGKDIYQMSTFKKPLSIIRLSLTSDIY